MTEQINTTFSYVTTFILDKAYFHECYEQTVIQTHGWRAYRKAMLMILVGLVLLMFIDDANYPASFIMGLGILEALSTKYQRAWWVTRQTLSRAADNNTELTIDQQGISIVSAYVNNQWAWTDLDNITATEKGWILVHKKMRYYLSNRCLTPESKGFLQSQAVLNQSTERNASL